MQPATEGQVLTAVLAYLNLRGVVAVRVNGGLLGRADGGRMRCNFATRGTCSDLLGVYRGRFLALEVKRPGGRPTRGQVEFLQAVRAAGGVAAVVDSVAAVEQVLEAIDSSK